MSYEDWNSNYANLYLGCDVAGFFCCRQHLRCMWHSFIEFGIWILLPVFCYFLFEFELFSSLYKWTVNNLIWRASDSHISISQYCHWETFNHMTFLYINYTPGLFPVLFIWLHSHTLLNHRSVVMFPYVTMVWFKSSDNLFQICNWLIESYIALCVCKHSRALKWTLLNTLSKVKWLNCIGSDQASNYNHQKTSDNSYNTINK